MYLEFCGSSSLQIVEEDANTSDLLLWMSGTVNINCK